MAGHLHVLHNIDYAIYTSNRKVELSQLRKVGKSPCPFSKKAQTSCPAGWSAHAAMERVPVAMMGFRSGIDQGGRLT